MEKGYYRRFHFLRYHVGMSQSTIKMEKGYYRRYNPGIRLDSPLSQSTIKMEKGYYVCFFFLFIASLKVAIHNKNGKGLLLVAEWLIIQDEDEVAIHNKNGKGLLLLIIYIYIMKKVLVAIHNKNGKGLLLVGS